MNLQQLKQHQVWKLRASERLLESYLIVKERAEK